MRDFPARPKGTLMSGTFASTTEAERALRVLKNAGYARAEVVADAEAAPGAPILIVVDAAATGAFRAAEILEDHGAEIRYESEPPSVPSAASLEAQIVPSVPPLAVTAFSIPPLAERKPRVRKRNRPETQATSVPLESADVIIVTRGIESVMR